MPSPPSNTVRILSWNVRRIGFLDRLPQIATAIESDRPDLVLLQEVPWSHDAWRELLTKLEAMGLQHATYARRGLPDSEDRRRYGSLIASRWPLRIDSRWKRVVRYPELFARATVEHPMGEIDAFSVHIPSGSGIGWQKIDHLLCLATALGSADDGPRIVAGDFNEPREVRTDGRIHTWAFTGRPGGGENVRHLATYLDDQHDDERELAWWDYGVRSVLDGVAVHGLRHAYHDRHGFDVAPVTYRTRACRRFFDHGFVSRQFDVADSGYHHDWRTGGLSDHSAMWMELRWRRASDLPPLIRWSED